MKRAIFLVGFGLLLITVMYWGFTHAYIEVSVNNFQAGDVIYSFYNQATNKTVEVKSVSPTIKKLVRRGSHEIMVSQSQGSYFAVIKTEGLLRTSKVKAKLEPEKARRFVGNNPRPCMGYIGNALTSYSCGDISNAKIAVHMPADLKRGTFTQPLSKFIEDSPFESSVPTKEGNFALFFLSPEDSPVQNTAHIIYQIGNNLEFLHPAPLVDLDIKKTYTLIGNGEGFVALSTSFDHILQYSSSKTKPIKVDLQKPTNKSLKPYSLSVDGNTFVTAYAPPSDAQTADFNGPKGNNVNSEVVVQSNGKAKHFAFNKKYGEARLCGNNRLCVLLNKHLEIYDIGGNQQKLLFNISKVNAMGLFDDTLIVVRESEVLGLGTKEYEGSIQYNLGNYKFCGFTTSVDNYTLCISGNNDKKTALQINPTGLGNDNIDKKIFELSKLKEISDVSIYGIFVFISPELGEPVSVPGQRGVDYDHSVVKNVNEKINQKINELGIDRKVYKIINPFSDY